MTRPFQWEESYNLGAEELDGHHKRLLEEINNVVQAVQTSRPSDEIRLVMLRLMRFARLHFRQEEKIMKHHGYPDFLIHRAHHDKMLDQLLRLGEDFAQHKMEHPQLASLLMEWWLTHLKMEDNMFKLFLNEQKAIAQTAV